MAQSFEPFSADVDRKTIPSGGWQRLVGAVLLVVGVFPALASTPFNGAGTVASLCFSMGSGFLFWGILLRYLSALEEKLGLLIFELGFQTHDDETLEAGTGDRRETPDHDAALKATAPCNT